MVANCGICVGHLRGVFQRDGRVEIARHARLRIGPIVVRGRLGLGDTLSGTLVVEACRDVRIVVIRRGVIDLGRRVGVDIRCARFFENCRNPHDTLSANGPGGRQQKDQQPKAGGGREEAKNLSRVHCCTPLAEVDAENRNIPWGGGGGTVRTLRLEVKLRCKYVSSLPAASSPSSVLSRATS